MTSQPPTNAHRPLILCIEDADIALRVKKLLLESVGYDVLTANSAEDGFQLFRQKPVKLVISDHYLGGKTGTEVARAMKALKPEVSILIVSGAAEKIDGLEVVNAFLTKGSPTQLFLDTVAQLLGE